MIEISFHVENHMHRATDVHLSAPICNMFNQSHGILRMYVFCGSLINGRAVLRLLALSLATRHVNKHLAIAVAYVTVV